MFYGFCFFILMCLKGYCLSPQDLSLEDKVGQLLIVQFQGKEVNEEAKVLIQELGVGGFIYYNWANGLDSPNQVKALSEGLQKLSKIPLLISLDQEGGVVARLSNGFTKFPGNKALGVIGRQDYARESAKAMGAELREVGVNFNLAPVVDINFSGLSILGVRSFGSDAKTVKDLALASIEGFQESKILTCLKHFPGHGDVQIDPHEDLPTSKKTRAELDLEDLVPFKELSFLADSIMTAHIMVPSIDPDKCATLSKPVLRILREDLGFKGAIISDSLVMEGVLKNSGSIEEAAIEALNAGCDLLILGGRQLVGSHAHLELTLENIKNIHRALVQAVLSGRILEERIDEGLQRVLDLKSKCDFAAFNAVDKKSHEELSQEIARSALQVRQNRLFSFSNKSFALFAPEILKETLKKTSIFSLCKEMNSLFFSGLNPDEEEKGAVEVLAESVEGFVVFSYNAWKNKEQKALIESLCKKGKPVIFIASRDPFDGELFSQADLVITTFSPVEPSLQAACFLLEKLCKD